MCTHHSLGVHCGEGCTGGCALSSSGGKQKLKVVFRNCFFPLVLHFSLQLMFLLFASVIYMPYIYTVYPVHGFSSFSNGFYCIFLFCYFIFALYVFLSVTIVYNIMAGAT